MTTYLSDRDKHKQIQEYFKQWQNIPQEKLNAFEDFLSFV